MKSLFLLTILAISCNSTISSASILLEPYLGYHSGKSTSSGAQDIKVNGLSYGGRVGWERLGLMLGVDYMTGAWTDNETPSAKVTPSNLGLFIGYDFPVLLRVYGEYIASSTMKVASDGDSGSYKGGSGFKLGVGASIIPMLSINLEYITVTYPKYQDETLDNKMTNAMFGLSVSVPLTF